MRRYSDSVANRATGQAVIGATIQVLNADGSQATVYSDNGITPIIQPVVTDGNGEFYFYIADGRYTLVIAGGGVAQTLPDVEIYDDTTAIRTQPTEAGYVLPAPNLRANQVFGFDGSGACTTFPSDQFRGPPGGNVMSIGTFQSASSMVIPAGAALVRTSGWGANGVGAADYIYDPAVNSLYVTQYPRSSFVSANGLGYRFDQEQMWTPEKFGGAGDAILDVTNYPTSATDNLPAILEMLALGRKALTASTWTSCPTVYWGLGQYWVSQLIEIHDKVDWIGCSSITAQSGRMEGTVWVFPKSQGALIIQDSGTTGRGAMQSPGATSAAGSSIRGFSFLGGGVSTDLTAHAIQFRTSGTLEAKIYQAAGNGVHIVGYTNGSAAGPYGNVNGCDIKVWVHSCGGDGVHNQGSDANASKFYVATHTCGGVGFYNGSYYANTIELGDIAGYGNTGVWYNGVGYQLVDPYSANTAYNGGTPTAGGATTPGTNTAVWAPQGPQAAAGGRYPAWVSGGTYYLQSPWFDTGSASIWPSGYIEQSALGPVINAPSFYMGGTAAGKPQPYFGAGLVCTTIGALTNATGMGGAAIYNVSSPQYSNDGTGASEIIGGLSGTYARHRFYNNTSSSSTRYTEYYINGNRRHAVNDPGLGGYILNWQTGAENAQGDTASASGRGSHQQNIIGFPLLALGNGGYNANNRIIQYGTAVPTTGDKATGEIIFNLNGTGGNGAWYCLSGGAVSTGTWAANTSYNIGTIVTLGGNTYVSAAPPRWAPNTAYAVGAVVTLVSTNQNYRLVCTAAGTSGSGNGPILTSLGATLTDGTVTWQAVASTSGSTGPSGTTSGQIDGSVYWNYRPTGFTFVKYGELFQDYSVTYAPGTLAAGATATTTVAAAIAAFGDFVEASFSSSTQGVAVRAWVSAAGTVSIIFVNDTGTSAAIASGTLRVRVKKAT